MNICNTFFMLNGSHQILKALVRLHRPRDGRVGFQAAVKSRGRGPSTPRPPRRSWSATSATEASALR